MKVGNDKAKITNYEVWVVPGSEQTLEDLMERFKDRIVKVDAVQGRILIHKENDGIASD